MVVFVFFFFRLEIPFWINLARKIKIVSLNCEIRYLDYSEYVKFDGDDHLFGFRPFFQVLSKKSVWHFGVTLLISQLRREASGFSCFN